MTMKASFLLTHFIAKCVMLAKTEVVHVLGSVEDERCFPSLIFLKNKLCKSLDEHMPYVVGMYLKKFFALEDFPY